MKTKSQSDFGKGFVYNLILFAKHWWKMKYDQDFYTKMRKDHPELFRENSCAQLWFNGASDHFYELEIPKQWLDTPIGKLASEISDKSLDLGHGSGLMTDKVTLKDYEEIFKKLEKLAMLIDKELGVKDIEAEWN